MNFNTNIAAKSIRHQLRKLPLFAKFSFLILVAILFFGLILFIDKSQLVSYSYVISFLLIVIGIITRLVIGQRLFWVTINLWVIGYIAYLVFMIPYALTDFSISPFIVLDDNVTRWVYILGFPFRVLGIFFAGLVFIEITSPIEFLKFGTVGLYLAFLFRTVEYTKQVIWENIDALRMQGKWPEQSKGIIRFREARLKIKHAPILIIVTFRNIICWSLPWAWLSFSRIQKNLKGD